MSSEPSSSSTALPPTELIHLTYEGNFQLECTAKVVSSRLIDEVENDKNDGNRKVEIILDTTAMHPQGGGQPTDIGTISITGDDCKDYVINVERVDIDRSSGIVTHKGTLSCLSDVKEEEKQAVDHDSTNLLPFGAGSEVKVTVDPENRRIVSECHTAGHVLDAAMARCGRIMPPTKGFHFLDGPYVEYKGSIPPNEREETIKSLNAAFQDLLNEDTETKIEALPQDEADKLCNRLAKNFNMSDYGEGNIRVVTVAGWSSPCGGTHVKSTAELKERGWTITGIKSKKGVVRVKYNPAK